MNRALAAVSSEDKKLTVVGGVDYLDRFKGVTLKLLAWESLLYNFPKYRSGYMMVQICLNKRNQQGLTSLPEIRAEVEEIADRIISNFPDALTLEIVDSFTLSDRLQIWQLADVFVNTAIREAGRPHSHGQLFRGVERMKSGGEREAWRHRRPKGVRGKWGVGGDKLIRGRDGGEH